MTPTIPPPLKCCAAAECERGATSTRYWEGRNYWAFHRTGPDGLTNYTETTRSYLRRTR